MKPLRQYTDPKGTIINVFHDDRATSPLTWDSEPPMMIHWEGGVDDGLEIFGNINSPEGVRSAHEKIKKLGLETFMIDLKDEDIVIFAVATPEWLKNLGVQCDDPYIPEYLEDSVKLMLAFIRGETYGFEVEGRIFRGYYDKDEVSGLLYDVARMLDCKEEELVLDDN